MLSCSSFPFYFSKSEFLPSYCPFPSPKNPWTKPKTNTWSDWIFSSSSSSSLELQCVLLLHYSGSDITEAAARNLSTLSPIWFPSLEAFAWIFCHLGSIKIAAWVALLLLLWFVGFWIVAYFFFIIDLYALIFGFSGICFAIVSIKWYFRIARKQLGQNC